MKPSIPKGTRDFSSTEVARRNYIFNTIKHSFELFGFQPIETPSFENSSTLMGKYGEEGDRLIFKILNSGDYLKGTNDDFYLNLFLIKQRINEGYSELKKYLEVRPELFSLFQQNDVVSFMNGLSDFDFFYDKDFDLFNQRKSYTLLKLSKVFFESNLGSNALLANGLVANLVKEFIQSHLRRASNKLTPFISEKALRYDLTVPFARYVVQHQNEITFPFKRYQIQPVWRADRPQKGRFREFYQCDADVVGSKSLLQEVEFVQLYDTVFTNLKLNGTTIKMNNRKILSGIAEVIGAKDKLIDFTVALDKLDKIGKDGVVKEMLAKGISENAIEKVQPLFSFTGTNEDKLNSLAELLLTSEEGTNGVEELRFVIENINNLGLQSGTLDIDVTLARGLNYYTGAIFEVSAPEGVKMGSIGGGGRYDDLTGIFGLKDVSGVGISFGLDRIFLVMEELGLFKEVQLPKPKVLFLNFDESENIDKLKAIAELRKKGIKAELYPDTASSNNQQKKQWKYVDKRDIAIVISGIEDGLFVVKNRAENTQGNLSLKELIALAK